MPAFAPTSPGTETQVDDLSRETMTDPTHTSGQHGTSPESNPADRPDPTASADAAGQGRLEPGIEARLADAEARAAEYMDMALRARAELDNLRKRAQIDLAAAHKYAIESFAESLLPVRDSLEMALRVDTPTVDNLREGVEATLRLLATSFDKHKLLAIDPAGEKFDPNRHQAISMVPAGDVPPNHVVAVLQKGYLINDRVLRPALVTVRAA
jgi:molecular chaperone GrpE